MNWIVAIPLVSLGLQQIFIGNVTSVPMTQKESKKDIENLTCGDHMQYILMENVKFVPRTEEENMYYKETKDLKCNHTMLKGTYVLNPVGKKTSIGCFCEKPVAVKKCLEYNENKNVTIIQPKGDAPCNDFSITPCKVKYVSSESYKLFECFEKYGGISSPIENQRNINFLKEKLEQSEMELEKKLEQRKLEIQELNKKLNQSKIEIQELNKKLTQSKTEIQELNTKLNQSKTEIQELKKKTIDLQKENDDSKIYKWIAIVLIILFVLCILYKCVHCQKLKNIIQKKCLKTRTMTGTENDDQATMSERKSDDQQKEENYDEDRSKRETRKEVGIVYRPDYVQPEESGDSDGDNEDDDNEIEGLNEELHTYIPLKRKPKTSAVNFESETH